MARKVYSAEFKKSAVALVTEQNYQPKEAAKNLGVNLHTLKSWLKTYRRNGQVVDPVEEADLRKRNTELEREVARLRMERDILKKSGGLLREGVVVKYAWIKNHREEFPIRAMCRVIGVSRSAFHHWMRCPLRSRQQRREKLIHEIRSIREERFMDRYGSPRMTMELNDRGVSVCENTVAKVMKEADLPAKTAARFIPRTTESNHDHPIASNKLDRNFDAKSPNQKWLSDITYIPTDEGWLYLAGVMDVFSRKIVGWSMSEKMPAELACDALTMAIARRRPDEDLLHHSDRGVQYACAKYQALLNEHEIECSMSRVGNCYDNAMRESFWSTLKREAIGERRFKTRCEARAALFEYIEVFYNRKRRHSSLGYISPERFEASGN